MDNQEEHLAIVGVGGNRKWKILGLFVAVICLISLVFFSLILFECLDWSTKTTQPMTTQITSLEESTASFFDSITTMEVITNSTRLTPSGTKISTDPAEDPSSATESLNKSKVPVSSTRNIDEEKTYTTYFLTEPVEYARVGRPLGNLLHFNVDQLCLYNGYVKSVEHRLFTDWKGNASLYLYVIPTSMLTFKIGHRSIIKPKRNTTGWQNVGIPPRVLPIYFSSFLAIGIQVGDTSNTVYGVAASGMSAGNINEMSTVASVRPDLHKSVALRYTIVHNVTVTTTKKPM